MVSNDVNLFEYLRATFKDGLSYSDAAKLCVGTYCYADLLPTSVPPESLNKENISQAFAEFARHGGISGHVLQEEKGHPTTDERHWLHMMASSVDVPDLATLRALLT